MAERAVVIRGYASCVDAGCVQPPTEYACQIATVQLGYTFRGVSDSCSSTYNVPVSGTVDGRSGTTTNGKSAMSPFSADKAAWRSGRFAVGSRLRSHLEDGMELATTCELTNAAKGTLSSTRRRLSRMLEPPPSMRGSRGSRGSRGKQLSTHADGASVANEAAEEEAVARAAAKAAEKEVDEVAAVEEAAVDTAGEEAANAGGTIPQPQRLPGPFTQGARGSGALATANTSAPVADVSAPDTTEITLYMPLSSVDA
jgi:hypothetical protein